MKPLGSNKHQRGFTLLETLIAGSILFIGLVGATLLSARAAQNAGDSVAQNHASKLAIQLVEEQAMRGYATLAAALGTTSGSYQAPSGKQLTYDLIITDTSGPPGGGSPNLGVPSVQVEARVRWKRGGTDTQEVRHATYVSP
jgi:type II secretory pathway pseudopilin PulG